MQLRNIRHVNRKRCHLVSAKGILKSPDADVWHTYWRDPYHLLLLIPWPGFLLLIIAIYGLLNAGFALIYLVGGGIANAQTHDFWDAFFFSVQTLTSIGYGVMYPQTPFANTAAAVEALVGLVGFALVTGLAFARFSQPTARVIFSNFAVITPYNGLPTLMFRVANQRGNQIVEAQIRAYLLRDEVSAEGQFMRRLYPLRLLRSQAPAFALTWTAIHPIDTESPLKGQTAQSLVQLRAQVVISLSGIDETVAQAVHAQYLFHSEEILWNCRLMDIIHETPAGECYIDFTHFHDVVPLQALA
ncbi:ATP-sensitive inward rectifier potassium channel 10 [Leptolyngbyaceae cyanobacterium CCMR0082]|uniref:ATP-sensitive inward rectifier potassium channel 10 n=2 Tax=Adonisia turfae TaxID=2950184 RepID=A0A6M0RZX0_9CYAN|nr:ATP-sensitive inward rectifier potassium channel 10 [Adonisia turfae CCMR0081]NEZ61443.1 ATP-sensitive inward rectifier potassium channel 10 [Adonisia turfae CCMR0082]